MGQILKTFARSSFLEQAAIAMFDELSWWTSTASPPRAFSNLDGQRTPNPHPNETSSCNVPATGRLLTTAQAAWLPDWTTATGR